ncbi:MAG TPA: prephenate dehydrogenase/arogenate dehydrogenase family protein, partial [Longimicrobiaceae bacterium]|nr:prephenate dehydrogenase/arogenate dehydrogenase family protein [Longimicrobiaceae bacterium]
IRSAAVVGLGLIGGSLARELAARGVRVLAHDRDTAALQAALEEGVVHASLGESLEGVGEADLLVIAVPVDAAPAVLSIVRSQLGSVRLVTDVGSTKQAVVRAAEALGIGERFVGSHPLAGDHRSGWSASRPGLFRDARVYLCPTPTTGEAALELARQLWTGLGAEPELLDAQAHDQRLAWTSHLPQAASTALAQALAAAGIAPCDLGPGGRDVTRLAGSSPEMWTGIALENAAALSGATEALEERLRELRAALRRGDEQAVHRFFEAGREWSKGNGSPPEGVPA